MELLSKNAITDSLEFKSAEVTQAEEQALKQVADTVPFGTDDETLRFLENYSQVQEGE